MKKTLKIAASVLIASTGLANADSLYFGIHSGEVSPGQITVSGDGNGYKTVDWFGNGIAYQTKIGYDTGAVGRIKSWRVEPRLSINGVWTNPFFLSTYASTKSYPKGARPKSIDEKPWLSILNSFVKPLALKACNDRLQGRLDGGMPPAQAYAAGAELPVTVDLVASVEATGPGKNNPTTFKESSVGVTMPVINCQPIQIAPETPGGITKAPSTPGVGSIVATPKQATLVPLGRPATKAKPKRAEIILKAQPASPARARE